MLPWKLRKHHILAASQNLLSVYFSPAKFQLVSCNLSLAMIWQRTYTHELPKLCSATLKKCICVLSVFIGLFVPNYFVKRRRTLLKLNFKGPCPSSEREIKFHRCLFTSSIKHEIRHFHVVFVQKRKRNVQKKCDARAKLLFCL